MARGHIRGVEIMATRFDSLSYQQRSIKSNFSDGAYRPVINREQTLVFHGCILCFCDPCGDSLGEIGGAV